MKTKDGYCVTFANIKQGANTEQYGDKKIYTFWEREFLRNP